MDEQRPLPMKKDPGFWRELWQQIRLVFRLVADPEVPFYLKILPFVTVIYLIIPCGPAARRGPDFGAD